MASNVLKDWSHAWTTSLISHPSSRAALVTHTHNASANSPATSSATPAAGMPTDPTPSAPSTQPAVAASSTADAADAPSHQAETVTQNPSAHSSVNQASPIPAQTAHRDLAYAHPTASNNADVHHANARQVIDVRISVVKRPVAHHLIALNQVRKNALPAHQADLVSANALQIVNGSQDASPIILLRHLQSAHPSQSVT
jgi:hypothetical protein